MRRWVGESRLWRPYERRAVQLAAGCSPPPSLTTCILLQYIYCHLQAVPHLYVDMAEALGAGSNLPAERAVPAVLGAIRKLSADVGIPRNLKELVSAALDTY